MSACIRSDGPTAQPSFHPVALNVFPALPTVMVRSHIPGNVAAHMGEIIGSWSSISLPRKAYTDIWRVKYKYMTCNKPLRSGLSISKDYYTDIIYMAKININR